MGQASAPAGTKRVGACLLLALLCAPPALAKPADAGERARRREERAQAQLEKKRGAWRTLPAYELGRREALAEAAAQCTAQGKVTVPVDPDGRPPPPPPPDWRTEALYTGPRARRPYVNGYLSCLRAHGHDPRYRDDLPVRPPELPPPEEELPPEHEAEREYLGRHARELWDDGVRQCEQDLQGRGRPRPERPAPGS